MGNAMVKADSYMVRLIKGHVGSGASIRLWIDDWATDKPFKVLFFDLFHLETYKSIFFVIVLICKDLKLSESGDWKDKSSRLVNFCNSNNAVTFYLGSTSLVTPIVGNGWKTRPD